MGKLTPRQVTNMSKDQLKKWLTDRDQKLPKTDHNKGYYVERVLEYQSAHQNDDSDVDMGPQVRSRSNRSTPSRGPPIRRKTPIRSRRHSEMPSGGHQTPTNQSTQKNNSRMTRSRRRTLDPGELHSGEPVPRSRSRTNPSRKNKGKFLPKPAKDMKKTELQDWLRQNDIAFTTSMLKSDLMQLVMVHAMAAPNSPPKKLRVESRTSTETEGALPTRGTTKRQLEDKTKPNAKRMRHSYRSDAMQGLMDSTDDEDDTDKKINDVAPVTPQPRRDGPLPPNLDMSPLTPQQPQDTVEKHGSTSPPMETQNSTMLSTPAFLRKVRRDGPKKITEDDRFQIRSEIRGMLAEVDDPTKPIASTYTSDLGRDEDARKYSRRRSSEHKEDPPLSRSLNFQSLDESDADEEKTAVMQTRLPKPPHQMFGQQEYARTKKHRRASEPVDIIPHQRIQFNPKVTRPTSGGKKKGNSSLNYLLGAVLVAVLAFVVYVFFTLENTTRFCDTNSNMVGNLRDADDNPLPCTQCPNRAECSQGVAVCDTQHVLIGTDCVLNKKVVQAGYEVRSQVSQILGEVRGRHECGEDIEKGYTESQLRDLIVIDDEGTLSNEAFDYFKEHILPNTATIVKQGGIYMSTRPTKTVGCQMREWASDNKLLVCSATSFLLIVLFMFAKYRRSKRNREMALNLKMQVMECLYERARSGRPEKYLPIDSLRNELKPPTDYVWKMVVEMMKHEHNVVKQEKMVNGVQRSCWEMTDVVVPRRQHRASLDPQMTSQWRTHNQTSHQHQRTDSLLAAPPPQPSWPSGQGPNRPLSNNFGGNSQFHPNYSPVSSQQEGISRTGDSQSAAELFNQNRRPANQLGQQEFTSSKLQGDGSHGQGFQFGKQFPVSSSASNW